MADLGHFARLALAEGVSESTLAQKVQAIGRLVAAGDSSPVPMDQLRNELELVASMDVSSARGAAAVLAAVTLLEQLDGGPAGVERQWPSSTPQAVAGPDHWPYCCTPAHWDMEPWRELDLGLGTHGSRDHWREQLEGKPGALGWRHPPVES